MLSIAHVLRNRCFSGFSRVVPGSLRVMVFLLVTAARGTQPLAAATAGETAQPSELRAGNLTPEQRASKLAAVSHAMSVATGGLTNDDCGGALPISNGTFAFSTVGASTDGPALPTSCEEGAGLVFGQDIWYCYTANCPAGGTVTVSLCGSSYDTRMALYSGCACPAANAGLVACNDDSCGLASQVTFSATSGAQFLIRVGGYGTANGTGTISISCAGACSVTCPARASVNEGEPGCINGYVDNFNGGCNSTPLAFSPLTCGQTVCGSYGTYVTQGNNYRDTDWYVFSTAGGSVTWSVNGEATTRIYLLRPTPDCANLTILGTAVSDSCDAATVTANLPAGTYYAFVATDAFTGVACGTPYTAELTCAPRAACNPLPADDDDVTHYACNCYDRLGITEAAFEAAVGGTTIDIGATDRKQLYVTSNGIILDINTNGAANPRAATSFPPSCDRPPWLFFETSNCYGNSYIRKWVLTATAPRNNSKVTVALLCRHKTVWTDDFAKFDDVAMIMHNRDNGETCWFQTTDGEGVEKNGRAVPAPHTAAATTFWHEPSSAAAINCIKCHDNGSWMNSRWMHNSGIGLSDGREAYINKGAGFETWEKPKFVYFDADGLVFGLKANSCTRCHGIHSAERAADAGGGTWENWLKFTVGQPPYPTRSNATGRDFPIAYWMPPNHGAANAAAWKQKYWPHVCLLRSCSAKLGRGKGAAKDPCKLEKERLPITALRAAASLIPGVHLYADADDDGAWDYESAAPSDPAAPPIMVSSGTPLSVGWSADADHLNCIIGTTFPAGVEVDGTWTGTNWLLNESPQTIGVLSVPGEYYFHIDCNDDDYDEPISASLTFQIPGVPPTVLRVEAIVNTNGFMAFDYPSPAEPHVDVPAPSTSTVHIAWMAYNVVADSCELIETFEPSGGHTPRTIPEEAGFESVPLYGNTDQNYRLTCTGNDGQLHSVDVTLQVQEGAAGDCDGDGDLDLGDWGCLADCLTGPGVTYAAGCGAFDFDADGDVDLMDAGAFLRAFTG